ncbi:MAG: hypothetical protein F6K11_36045, partial [Leptolyngbya sp. SIO3F4]|nr:hypothetical protein [Leptolyngbya sp. SIO3F4]
MVSRIALFTTRLYKYVCLAVIVACVLILYASIYPGQPALALHWPLFAILLVVVPPLGLLTLPIMVWCLWRCRRWLFSTQLCPRWLAITGPVIAGITWALVMFNIPTQLTFRLSQDAFQKALDSVPVSVKQVDEKIGPYTVDRYSTDSRGGVYFRVTSGDIGLDMISLGFAYQPNEHGSPFGEYDYTLRHLIGDWYMFSHTASIR